MEILGRKKQFLPNDIKIATWYLPVEKNGLSQDQRRPPDLQHSCFLGSQTGSIFPYFSSLKSGSSFLTSDTQGGQALIPGLEILPYIDNSSKSEA